MLFCPRFYFHTQNSLHHKLCTVCARVVFILTSQLILCNMRHDIKTCPPIFLAMHWQHIATNFCFIFGIFLKFSRDHRIISGDTCLLDPKRRHCFTPQWRHKKDLTKYTEDTCQCAYNMRTLQLPRHSPARMEMPYNDGRSWTYKLQLSWCGLFFFFCFFFLEWHLMFITACLLCIVVCRRPC